MKTLTKINALIATYTNHASTENEQDSALKLANKILIKQFSCDNLVAMSVVCFIIDAECYFPKLMLKENPKSCINTQSILEKLGINFIVENYGDCFNLKAQ